MEVRDEIEKLLIELKNKGIDRRKVERDLGLSVNYLDQSLSRGGNRSIYRRIKQYIEAQNIADNYTLEDRAVVKALVKELLKLKSKITGIPEDVWKEEFDRDTTLILNDLRKRI